MTKTTKQVIILLILAIIIAVIPLLLRKGAEFGGSDDAASSAIEELNPDYQVWADPLMEPASGEIESLLFCLQAGLGAGVFGFVLGRLVERKKKDTALLRRDTPMLDASKKAILIVSFGTSFEDTRKITIEAIEHDIEQAYPDYHIYRAWTSKMIMSKLLKRDGIKVLNVREAMEQMAADGITDVIVQPTHVINGIENDLMKEDALSYQSSFQKICFGNPMLTSEEDNNAVVCSIAEEFSDLKKDEVLVLMGHGTTHSSNSIYAGLNFKFRDESYPNIFLGTVEAYPTMESILRAVKEYQPKKVVLAPFMIVAGDHAKNDMAGDHEDSWRTQFEQAGYPVRCVLKGLGEYPNIRKLFLKHVKDAISLSQNY